MIVLATVAAKSLLSVLVTLRGRVSEIRPVSFLGRRNRRPWLKPSVGGVSVHDGQQDIVEDGGGKVGAALHAAKEMPSGPGEELLESLMACVMASMPGV